ncbi:MAG: hypothetical protein WA213_18680 [Terriglobales bacterium]
MGNEPATRADLEALEGRIDGRLESLEVRFDGKLDAVEQRILDRVGEIVRDSETRLLQAFYGFAEAINKRFNQIDGNVAIFINRLGTLENRILELEKRLNIPPAV